MADIQIVESKVGVIGGTLRVSVGNANSRWRTRRSALLALRDERGNIGLGEAAPLPGYSDDTLDACVNALETPHRNKALPPAAAFAIETAMLDLRGQRAALPIHRLLSEKTRPSVKRAGLIDGPPESWAAGIEALAQRGIRTFKIKVGRPDGEIEALRTLRGTIRLDANGAWSHARLAECAGLGIEFVEQPVPPGELAELGACPVPWAADESLRNPAEVERLLESPCAAFVLKPAVLGGLRRCLDLARRASERGIGSVASHLFDGPIALAACCELALSLPGPALACGVDTHGALTAFPAMEIPQLRVAGEIVPAMLPGLGFTEAARLEIASWIS